MTSTFQKTALSVNLNKVALVRNTRHLGIPSVTRAATLSLADGLEVRGGLPSPAPSGRFTHEGGQFGNGRHESGRRRNAPVAGQFFLAGAFLFSSVMRLSLKSMEGAEKRTTGTWLMP